AGCGSEVFASAVELASSMESLRLSSCVVAPSSQIATTAGVAGGWQVAQRTTPAVLLQNRVSAQATQAPWRVGGRTFWEDDEKTDGPGRGIPGALVDDAATVQPSEESSTASLRAFVGGSISRASGSGSPGAKRAGRPRWSSRFLR